jgi:hypothetical protein
MSLPTATSCYSDGSRVFLRAKKTALILKASLVIFFLNVCICSTYSQIERLSAKEIDGSGFKSCFQKLKSGDFSGSMSGVLLLVKNGSTNVITHNFLKEKSVLNIVYDKDEVYDVSRKNYLTQKSGIKLRYTTYCFANCFELIINGDTCRYNVIDGGCDLVIDGLEWRYYADDDRELLFLNVTKDFGLWKRRTSISSYVVKAGSVLCFNIRRKK